MALSLLMVGVTPITLTRGTEISNQNWKHVITAKQTRLSDSASNSACVPPSLANNCLTEFNGFASEQLNIQTNSWQSQTIKPVLPQGMIDNCSPNPFQANSYLGKSLATKSVQLDQLLSYYQPTSGSVNSISSKQILPSLVNLSNPRCGFAWQQRLQQKSLQFHLSKGQKLVVSQGSKVNQTRKQSQYPQLSRSSLIVTFPYHSSSFVPKSSKLANPAPQTKRIASSFGWRKRPYSNQLQFHQGIDYGAPLGSPVVAAGNGIVTKVVSGCADFSNLFCGGQLGNWIEVDHGRGKIGIYGHLKQGSIQVQPGMKVWKNQRIAQVGSSGWSTGAHLDFRLKVNGKHEDPAKHVMAIQENYQANQ